MEVNRRQPLSQSCIDYLLQLNCDGSVVEVYGLVKKAVEEFIEHTEREK